MGQFDNGHTAPQRNMNCGTGLGEGTNHRNSFFKLDEKASIPIVPERIYLEYNLSTLFLI